MMKKFEILLVMLSVIATFSGSLLADALVYEPFSYEPGLLDGKGGDANDISVGLEGTWTGHGTDPYVVAGSLAYGTLPVAGNSIASSGASNHFGGARIVSQSALADNGLLEDGATLWFSLEMGYNVGGNLTNSRLAFAFGNDQFNGGNYNYWINNDGTQLGSAIGVIFGRLSVGGYSFNGSIAATEFRDSASGDGLAGNIYGSVYKAGLGAGEHALVVLKVTWGADSDVIEVYAPDTDLNLGAPVSTLTVDVDQSVYDTISWARGDGVIMDEIRMGGTLLDVLGYRGPSYYYPEHLSTVPPGEVTLSWTNIPAAGDPNGPVYVDVYFGNDPLSLTQIVDADVDGQDVESYALGALATDTYYWRVDSYIDGAPSGNIIEGPVVMFNNDYAPVPDIGPDLIGWRGLDVQMVMDNGDDGASAVTYWWSASPGSRATFDDPNLATPVVNLSNSGTNNPTTVTITVEVSDENSFASVTDTMTIDIYNSACDAIRIGSTGVADNLTDIDGDCDTTFSDFALLAGNWLIDTSSTGSVNLE